MCALGSLWNRLKKNWAPGNYENIFSLRAGITDTVSESKVTAPEQGNYILQRRWVPRTRSLARAIARQGKKSTLDGVVWATMPISVPPSTTACSSLFIIKDKAELQGRLLFFSPFFLLPKSFPLSAFMLLLPEDKCSCSQDQRLLVAKTECL